MTAYSRQKAQGQVATSAGAILTADAAAKVTITGDSFYNSHSAALALTLYNVDSGDSVAADTCIGIVNIPTGQTARNVLVGTNVKAGGTIQAVTGTGSVLTYTISYLSISE